MKVYRKSLMIQFLLFIVFFIMGVNKLVVTFFAASSTWLGYVLLGILVVFAVTGFYLYRKNDQRISVITPQEVQTIRYLLYGYFFVYLIDMILPSFVDLDQKVQGIIFGVLLMGIALYGAFIQLKILKAK
jgi:hypothetical protein